MRFSKQIKASHAARLRELMPQGFTDDAQLEISDDFFADTPNCFDIAKKVSRTAFSVYQPFSSNVHDDCLKSFPWALRRTDRRNPESCRRTLTGYKESLLRASSKRPGNISVLNDEKSILQQLPLEYLLPAQ